MPADPPSYAPVSKPERQRSLWESPDGSVAVYLTFEVIDAISQALTEIAAAPPVRGAEIGGLLLGKSERQHRLTVWIDRFEPVACSYPRGASWMLTEEEQDQWAAEFAQEGDAQVVGFFRSHTRKDLFLSEDDMGLISRFFSDAGNVFLLVKPFTTRPNLGGFFYWEHGSIHRVGSRLEFPFNRRELGGGESVAVVAPPTKAWVRTEEQPAIPPNEANETEDPMFLRHPEVGRAGQVSLLRKLGILLGAVTLCVGAYAAYVRYGGHSLGRVTSRGNAAVRAVQPEGTIRLSATEGDKSVTLTWDRASLIVSAATHATVEIAEGSFHKVLELSPEDLRAGRVVYSRPDAISDTVSFRMQLNTGQGEPFSETVRFVSREAVVLPAAPVKPFNEVRAKSARAPRVAEPPPVNEIKAAETPPPVEPPKTAPAPPKILRPAPRREPEPPPSR